MRQHRIGAIILTAIGGMCASTAWAATFNDATSGSWNDPGTWGGTAPSVTTDDITIDEHLVTVPGDAAVNGTITAFTGGQITVTGTGELRFTGTYDFAPVPLNLVLNNGIFNTGHANRFTAGAAGQFQTIDISGVSTIRVGPADGTSIGDSGQPVVLNGSGTLIKEGAATLALNGNASVDTNPSTFDGVIQITEGTLEVGASRIIDKATIILGGGTARLHSTWNNTSPWQQTVVTDLRGTGTVSWSNSRYARDLAVGTDGVLDPGTEDAPGTITRSTSFDRNDLDFKSGSKLVMDVFGPDASDADQIIWKDPVNNSVMDFADGTLEVRLFTPDDELTLTQWVLIDGDELGDALTGSSTSAHTPTRPFASHTFLDLDGNPIDLWDGTALDSGWTGLDITYAGTTGQSNRQVILSGSYILAQVPEPTALGLLALGGLAVSRRRKGV